MARAIKFPKTIKGTFILDDLVNAMPYDNPGDCIAATMFRRLGYEKRLGRLAVGGCGRVTFYGEDRPPVSYGQSRDKYWFDCGIAEKHEGEKVNNYNRSLIGRTLVLGRES